MTVYFTHRDQIDRRDELERVDVNSEMRILKEGRLPGAYGGPDLYVVHIVLNEVEDDLIREDALKSPIVRRKLLVSTTESGLV